ncbi:MAG: ABC transporter substrate-binding protein, partial [Gemmatimonadota bacterium]
WSCAPGETGNDGRSVVRIGMRPYVSYSPLFLTEARGFFDAHGIDVEFVTVQSGATSIPLLTTGQLDVLPTGVSPGMLRAVALGERVRYVASLGWLDPGGCAPVTVVGRRGFVDGVPSSRGDGQLRVSMPREPYLRYFVERAMSSLGLSVEADSVEVVALSGGAELGALTTGAIDIGTLGTAQVVLGVEANDLDVIGPMHEILPGDQLSMIVFGPRLLDDDPDLGRRFMVAYLEGVRAYREGKTPENVDALAEFLGYPEDLIREMCWMSVQDDGAPEIASLQKYGEWFVARGWLDRAPGVEETWDPSFVRFANETARTDRDAGQARTVPRFR